MQLALFTPGAYVWPVHRNFEAFIAALGLPGNDALDLGSSTSYPARQRTDSSLLGFPERLDARLTRLHRDLYDALLRPREYFAREKRSLAEVFWPDLRDTAAHALLEALVFYFVRRPLAGLPVLTGLNILRAVFFNHEAAEPALWVSSTQTKLAAERADWPADRLRFAAPATARVHDLAFCIHAGRSRPPLSPGWLAGQVRRSFDGQLWVECEAGRDPGRDAAGSGSAGTASAVNTVEADVRRSLERVFGWREARAA